MFLYDACMNISDENYEAVKKTIQDMFDELDEKETLSDKQEREKDSLEDILYYLERKDYDQFKTDVHYHQSEYGGMKRKKLYDPAEELACPEEHYITLKQAASLLGTSLWLYLVYHNLLDKLSQEELEDFHDKMVEFNELITDINNQIY